MLSSENYRRQAVIVRAMKPSSVRVECSERGTVSNIRIDSLNCADTSSLLKFKAQIAALVSIPPDDQILLVGPPYKRLESLMCFESQPPDSNATQLHVFVYDRRIISEPQRRPIETILAPLEIPTTLPQLLEPPIRASPQSQQQSPLLKALCDYETHFVTNLSRGELYVSLCDQSLTSCKRTLQEELVQIDATSAALSNLRDHFSHTNNSFLQSEEKLLSQQNLHEKLLYSFESNLSKLKSIPLHNSFIDAIEDLQLNITSNVASSLNIGSGSDGASANSSKMAPAFGISEVVNNAKACLNRNQQITLLDCLPIEKERVWHLRCVEVHQKVQSSLEQLRAVFLQVSNSVKETSEPLINASLDENIHKVEEYCKQQQRSLLSLRDDYKLVYETIATATNDIDEVELVNLLKKFESSRKIQENEILVGMKQKCDLVFEIKKAIGDSKTELTLTMYETMRKIAAIQTDIQFKLKKGLDIMRKWQKGHNEYFNHLDSLSKIPDAYESLLLEIIRRQRFNSLFELRVKEVSSDLSQIRNVEINFRENFMRSQSLNLPPIFFQLIPSLKDKPSYFTANLTTAEWLPDVAVEDLDAMRRTVGSGGADSGFSGEHVTKASFSSSKERLVLAEETEFSNEEKNQKRIRELEYKNALLMTEVSDLMKQKTLAQNNAASRSRSNSENTIINEQNPAKLPSVAVKAEAIDINSLLITLLDGFHKIQKILSDNDEDSCTNSSKLTESSSNDGSNKTAFNDTSSYKVTADKLVSETIDVVISAKKKMLNLRDSVEEQTDFINSSLSNTVSNNQMLINNRISFLDFNIGDIAIFLPGGKVKEHIVYMAFHIRKPHRYLSQESLDQFTSSSAGAGSASLDYVLGRIVFVESHLTSKGENPYALPLGEEYFIVHAERI